MNKTRDVGLRDSGFLDLALSGNLNLGKVTKTFSPSTLSSALVRNQMINKM